MRRGDVRPHRPNSGRADVQMTSDPRHFSGLGTPDVAICYIANMHSMKCDLLKQNGPCHFREDSEIPSRDEATKNRGATRRDLMPALL